MKVSDNETVPLMYLAKGLTAENLWFVVEIGIGRREEEFKVCSCVRRTRFD